MKNVIEITGVKKRFPKGTYQLELPRLAVPEGYITGFIGENGAGKTTTLKLMMDMLFPEEGSVSIFGMDARKDAESIKKMVGYIGEQTGYLEQARLKDIKGMIRPFYETWDDTVFNRYADRFSFDLKKKFKELSKGQQKQFALSITLSHHPKLLLLDEPTANLDPLVRQDILDILAEEMQSEGVTVFFSTHITSDLDKIADYLLFLHGGRLLLEGEKDEVVNSRRMVKGRGELCTPEVRACFVDMEKSAFGFAGLTDQPEAVFALLGNESVYERPTVEDVFLAYTRRERGRAI